MNDDENNKQKLEENLPNNLLLKFESNKKQVIDRWNNSSVLDQTFVKGFAFGGFVSFILL